MTPQDKISSARQLLGEARKALAEALQSERSRRRGDLMRQMHALSNMLETEPRFFSQAGQDRLVDGLLNGKHDGVFADVGGYDGVTGSNTLFFEIFRGWSGILVEPAPTQMRKAEAVRRCPCIPVAVAGAARDLEFMEVTQGYTQMSGFLDSYDANLLAQVRGDPRHQEVVHTLQAKPLGDILGDAGLGKIDYLSLDVEGGEMDILETFDFNAFDITLWSIENNTGQPDIPKLMQDRGYDLLEFAGVDEIYRKKGV